MKFVDIKNDIAFRKIFGNEKKTEIIISFINAILDLSQEEKIIKVEMNPTYQLPVIKDLKSTILDVRVTDQKEHSYIVEMQVEEKAGFDKRLQYYTAKRYVSQIERGEDYPKLKKVILIAILDYNFTKSEDYISKHLILDTKTYEHSLKDFDYNFVELKKFTKKLDDITTLSDKWIYFLKHSDKLDKIPSHIKDKGLFQAYLDANTHSWSKKELEVYDYVSMRKQDERGKFTFVYKKGEKAGIKQGIEQGIEQEKVNSKNIIKQAEEEKKQANLKTKIVILFHVEKKSKEEISVILKISIDEIEKIIETD